MSPSIRPPTGRIFGLDFGDWSLLLAGFILAGIVTAVLGRLF
jgi:hypothetical protein